MDPSRIRLEDDRYGLIGAAFRPGNRAIYLGHIGDDYVWSIGITISAEDDIQTVEIDDHGAKSSRMLTPGTLFEGLEILAAPGPEAYLLVGTFTLMGMDLTASETGTAHGFAEILRAAADDRDWRLPLRLIGQPRDLQLSAQGRDILRQVAAALEIEGRAMTSLSAARRLELSVQALDSIRRRISRKTLQAYRMHGRWYVVLDNLARSRVAAEATPVEPVEPDVPAVEAAPDSPAAVAAEAGLAPEAAAETTVYQEAAESGSAEPSEPVALATSMAPSEDDLAAFATPDAEEEASPLPVAGEPPASSESSVEYVATEVEARAESAEEVDGPVDQPEPATWTTPEDAIVVAAVVSPSADGESERLADADVAAAIASEDEPLVEAGPSPEPPSGAAMDAEAEPLVEAEPSPESPCETVAEAETIAEPEPVDSVVALSESAAEAGEMVATEPSMEAVAPETTALDEAPASEASANAEDAESEALVAVAVNASEALTETPVSEAESVAPAIAETPVTTVPAEDEPALPEAAPTTYELGVPGEADATRPDAETPAAAAAGIEDGIASEVPIVSSPAESIAAGKDEQPEQTDQAADATGADQAGEAEVDPPANAELDNAAAATHAEYDQEPVTPPTTEEVSAPVAAEVADMATDPAEESPAGAAVNQPEREPIIADGEAFGVAAGEAEVEPESTAAGVDEPVIVATATETEPESSQAEAAEPDEECVPIGTAGRQKHGSNTTYFADAKAGAGTSAADPASPQARPVEFDVSTHLRGEIAFLRQQSREKDRQINAWVDGPKWLQPFVDQMRALEQQVERLGALQVQRDSDRIADLISERDALRERLDAVEARIRSEQAAAQPEIHRRSWFRRMMGSD